MAGAFFCFIFSWGEDAGREGPEGRQFLGA